MLSLDVPFSLNYLPLTIQLECCEEAILPEFLGSTLRGALGWVLQSEKTAYYYLFENRRESGGFDIVNPYIIEPPKAKRYYQKGEILSFSFILLGNAALYKEAVFKGLIRSGYLALGAGRKKFRLNTILHSNSLKTIWSRENSMLQLELASSIPLIPMVEVADWCSVQLQTPLRIRRQGSLLEELDFPTLIRNITKRVEMINERYGGQIDKASLEKVNSLSSEIQQRSNDFIVQQVDRYSNRKNQKMDFSGLLGVSTFEGELTNFTTWLKAAEILHIGRNTTFGYGKVEIILGKKTKQ